MTDTSTITPELRTFIEAQHIFFVASAPSGPGGHVNLSPKGLDSFRVFSESRVGYLDLTGSGNETAAHIVDNGRVTLMFCAFESKPQIARLYGQGIVVLPDDARWPVLIEQFPKYPGTRQIILMDVVRTQISCGMGVPLLSFAGSRKQLVDWAKRKGEDGMAAYRDRKNRESIDGLLAPWPKD